MPVEGLSDDYRDVPRLEKPYAQDDLKQAIAQALLRNSGFEA